METANTLNLLCYIFGDHYGSSFNILNTPIHFVEIDTIKTLVELGELSPEEIHEKIIQRHEQIKQHALDIGETGTNNNFNTTAIFGQRFDHKGNLIE